MLIVAGEAVIEAGAFDRVIDATRRMIMETRKEDGCLSYSFAQDLVDPTVIRIFELWRDQEALNAHFRTPHMAAFNAALAGIEVKSITVKTYEIGAVRDNQTQSG